MLTIPPVHAHDEEMEPMNVNPNNDGTSHHRNDTASNKKIPGVVIWSAVVLVVLVWVVMFVGLVNAGKILPQSKTALSYGSPLFTNAMAVLTAHCKEYPIDQDHYKGLGLTTINTATPSVYTKFAFGFILFSAVALVVEAIAIYYAVVNARDRNTERQRPNFCVPTVGKYRFPAVSAILTVTAYICLICLSVRASTTLPRGMTKDVVVAYPVDNSPLFCRATLRPPGLRGLTLEYLDGVFEAWGGVWFGTP
jgi:hypothetical protein